MKQIKNIIGLVVIGAGLLLTSCDESLPTSAENAYDTTLLSVKILNGGIDNTVVMEGTINEDKKEISFPRIEPEADFSALQIEASLPEGAELTQQVFDFTMEEGEAQKTLVLRVKNNTRYRDYLVTVRQKVPVWGADFSDGKVKVYDFSKATENVYPHLSGANTRCADMDKDYVLIVSRHGGTLPHLLKIEDLKQNNANNPIMLGTGGITGGTFAVSGGVLGHSDIYVSNMATPGDASGVKIYHWTKDNPTGNATLLAEFKKADIPGYAAGRFGDYMSGHVDENGNGYLFLGVNGSQATYKALRLKVSNHTTISEPTLINPATYGGFWATFNTIEEASGSYIYTGHQGGIMLADANGNISYTLSTAILPALSMTDATVINFNNERYLVGTSVGGTGALSVYNITKGGSVSEALSNFASSLVAPAYTYSLVGTIAAGTGAGMIGWFKDGDETLYIMTGGPEAGFAICEFPKAVAED